MDIDDFEIKIKTYQRAKNVVIVNIVVKDSIEIRGFVVRFTITKYSPSYPVWIVSPPSVRGRNKAYFWIVKFKDSALWQQLEERIVARTKEYVEQL